MTLSPCRRVASTQFLESDLPTRTSFGLATRRPRPAEINVCSAISPSRSLPGFQAPLLPSTMDVSGRHELRRGLSHQTTRALPGGNKPNPDELDALEATFNPVTHGRRSPEGTRTALVEIPTTDESLGGEAAADDDGGEDGKGVRKKLSRGRLPRRIWLFGQIEVPLKPELIAISLVYLVQGLLGLSRLAVFTFFKDDLELEPVTVGILTGLTAAPWVIKPLYGFLSDAVPLFGYRRRSYLVRLRSLCVCSWSAL